MIKHKCTVNLQDPILSGLKWHQRLRLISASNPLRLSYFRSDVSVREESYRHLRTNKYAIHPFSKFRGWYEVYLVFLYFFVIFTKPFDAAFFSDQLTETVPMFKYYTFITDVLCWVDIFINFVTGFELPKNRLVELRPWYIAKHYLFGPHFFFDVISSIPKASMYYLPASEKRLKIIGVVATMSFFKLVRLPSFVMYVHRSAEFLRVKSRGKLFLFSSSVASLMIINLMGCLQFFLPSLVRMTFNVPGRETIWYVKAKLDTKSPIRQYVHCIFKSSAYILGIRLNIYSVTLTEEYLLSLFTYLLGKILIAFIWIILAVAILNSRLMEIKYEEMLNQLEEYMRQKQLPLNLRNKLLQYFSFKYRNRFFKETLINSLLSENLRNEANLHVCKSLIKNVSLFADLNPMQLRKVVDCLVLEIFMPNDTIIHAGTFGDAVYFLFSGTVAVYSHAGKEICHLQDGAYFGEISLLLKGHLRSTTIVALETSQVYRLNKKDFERYLMNNKEVKTTMLRYAESRLKETTRMDEEYKEKLFEESYRAISPGT
ncbi:potassium/sodium hyperpolarization-activated cyclic nucleotide-gated channel 3-like [Anoplophora glabripennis]|uniref:potassium/sodium hyperpolarization-activated cyclic nucleotide-gated channel 3-like n=1 Tax=Anoplophora glabripennis TaxID=217634 RepID=UPI0008745A06|nr:potassium/sodium hyperpolarization-activated cyclic nucleotide-gated channel 3-like [Anoplophora glabripennis]